MPRRFLDTNILLRYLTNDDPVKAQRALALLVRVEQGQERVTTSALVVFETVFTLQTFYRLPRQKIRERVGAIIQMEGLDLHDKQGFLRGLDLYAGTSISFADAYNAAFMEAAGLQEIYSWDQDFDKIPGLVRVEPTDDTIDET